ncbi:MAG: hypothetical protein RL117_758 [Verrucomicrobiota bacterium]
MKLGYGIAISVCLFSAALGQVDEVVAEDLPPLPEWSSEDMRRWELGESLISDLLFQSLKDAENVAPIIEGFSWQQYERELAEEKKVSQIPQKILAQYFSQKPTTFLIDPQNILTRQEYRDRLSFLKYHDSDSQVGLYVYLFEGHQKLEQDHGAQQVIQQHFAESGPTAIVFYYMEEPGRAELCLSDELLRSVGGAERARALQSAINQARVKSQPVDQLDSFCVQMSIRLYWMEKAWQAGVIAPLEVSAEIISPRTPVDWRLKLQDWWARWGWFFVFTCLVCATAWIIRRRQRQRRKYRLSTPDVVTRLGYPHAAAVSKVLSFSTRRRSTEPTTTLE